jgi:G:T-mismatch repair DNA endonuclease (very short patch repair protein)
MKALEEAGWRAWVVWECETRQPVLLKQLAERIANLK